MMEEYYIYNIISDLSTFRREMIWVTLGLNTTVARWNGPDMNSLFNTTLA